MASRRFWRIGFALLTACAGGSADATDARQDAADERDSSQDADAAVEDAAAPSEAGDAPTSETCKFNACGGCASLDGGAPGAPCGVGGLFWVCRSSDELVCGNAQPPTGVAASDDRDSDVRVTWQAPSGSQPTNYVVLRDGSPVAEVGAGANEWLDTTAEPAVMTTPSDVRATMDRADGVLLTWSPAVVTSGAAHEYSVKARYGSIDSTAAGPRTGRRAVPAHIVYEWTRDDGATWTQAGEGTSALISDAPAATLAGGTANATEDVSRTLARLALTSEVIAKPIIESYRVRAVAEGSATAASPLATGARASGPLKIQWERSTDESGTTFSALPTVTGALWVDADAPVDATRSYRAGVSAPGSSASVYLPTQPVTVRRTVGVSTPDGYDSFAPTFSCALTTDGHASCWGRSAPQVPDVQFDAIATASNATLCGIRSSDKHVQCSGYNAFVDKPVVALELSASMYDGCTIDTSGHVDCFGANADPFPQDTMKAVSVGDAWVCGLRADDSIACVGGPPGAVPPSGAFASISVAFGGHACAVRTDGSFACWGDPSIANAIPSSERFRVLKAGLGRSCGVRLDGTIGCWGTDAFDVPQDEHFTALSLGQNLCGVSDDGRVRCWGKYMPQPPVPDLVTAVATGGDSSCALRADHTALCWGALIASRAPNVSATFETIVVGYNLGCGLDLDGHVACWGDSQAATVPSAIASGAWQGLEVVWADWQNQGACAFSATGLACWGGNPPLPNAGYAQVAGAIDIYYGPRASGLDLAGSLVFPWTSVAPPAERYVRISAVGSRIYAIRASDRRLVYLELTTSGGDQVWTERLRSPERFIDVSARVDERCAIRDDGALRCWTVDDGSDYSPSPYDRFVQVSNRSTHGCAVRTDGHILCWGENLAGQVRTP